MKKRKKIYVLIIIIPLFIFQLYFINRFKPFTKINDVDITGLTVNEAKEKYHKKQKDYKIKLIDKDKTVIVTADDFFNYNFTDDLISKKIKNQNPFFNFPENKDFGFYRGLDTDYDLIKNVLTKNNIKFDDSVDGDNDNNAYIKRTKNGFEIVPEKNKEILDWYEAKDLIVFGIVDKKTEIDLTPAYMPVLINKDSDVIVNYCDKLNKIANKTITLKCPDGYVITIGFDIFGNFLNDKLNANENLIVNKEKLSNYIYNEMKPHETEDKKIDFNEETKTLSKDILKEYDVQRDVSFLMEGDVWIKILKDVL